MSQDIIFKDGQLAFGIKDLPSIPPLIADALRVIDNPSASMTEIEAVIMRDQALAARLLKVVNSAAFGMSRRIETIREAATITGTRQVRAIAGAMLTSSMFAKPLEGLEDPQQIWSHALASSVWAMEIIEVVRLWDAQSAVMAALLHDIGIVLLCEYAPDRYREVLEMSRSESVHHEVIENRELGVSHAFVGASLCAKWALPVAITQLVSHHHDVDCPADHAQGVLMLADYMASEDGFRPFSWSVPRAVPDQLLETLDVDGERYAQLCERRADVHARANVIADILSDSSPSCIGSSNCMNPVPSQPLTVTVKPCPVAVVVNDDPTQLAILTGLLRKQKIDAQPFTRAEDALAAMGAKPPDLVVTGVHMPGIDGWRFCRLLRSSEFPRLNIVPILVVSATFAGDEPRQIAVDVGADAFLAAPVDGRQFADVVEDLLRHRGIAHPPAVLIVEDSRMLAGLLKRTFDMNGYHADIAGTARDALEAVRAHSYSLAILDYIVPDGKGDQLLDVLSAEQPECMCLMMTGEPDPELALDWMRRGATAYLRKPFDPEYLLEICARSRREHTLLRSVDLLDARTQGMRKREQEYTDLFTGMQEGFALHEIVCGANGEPVDYRFLTVNPAFEQMTGLQAENLIGRTVLEVLPGTEATWIDIYGRVALTGESVRFDGYFGTLGKYCRVVAFRSEPNRFACIIQDITAQKQAEDDHVEVQKQLVQAQKLESIGRLAGGVAHDFNNMLSVILGHAEMGLEAVDPEHEVYADLEAIRDAAERSARLTRQLLTFARKQAITPRVLAINTVVADMYKLLKRLIGESIALEWRPGDSVWPVNVDPSQIDQVLANLCVNARDAIVADGAVLISTENRTISDSDCARIQDAKPGDYVRLRVQDTGSGMDAETLSNLFEPFFTTKAPGMGTGLGLSTVYGIIRQNEGFITVHSAAGQGSEFNVYLPRFHGPAASESSQGLDEPPARGKETLLVVEDEQALRDLIGNILDRLGYRVLKAAMPSEAIEQARQHVGSIDLLLTDMMMPEMDGRTLAKKIQELHPTIHCVFMSGYTADVIDSQGERDPGINLLQKPVPLTVLADTIRNVLEGGKADVGP